MGVACELSIRSSSGDLETRHRLLQFVGRLGQLTHQLRGRARAVTGLLGHREDVLDVGHHHVGGFGFAQRLRLDLLNQLGQLARHAVDVVQGGTGGV